MSGGTTYVMVEMKVHPSRGWCPRENLCGLRPASSTYHGFQLQRRYIWVSPWGWCLDPRISVASDPYPQRCASCLYMQMNGSVLGVQVALLVAGARQLSPYGLAWLMLHAGVNRLFAFIGCAWLSAIGCSLYHCCKSVTLAFEHLVVEITEPVWQVAVKVFV
jgi:hypothetical protein